MATMIDPPPFSDGKGPNAKMYPPKKKICKNTDKNPPNLNNWFLRQESDVTWLTKLATALRKHFGEEGSYCFKKFPDGYHYFNHFTKRVDSSEIRRDGYLYGHPTGGRYRSTNEFLPHLIWLASDPKQDPNNCACQFCSKKITSTPIIDLSSPEPSRVRQPRSRGKRKGKESAPLSETEVEKATNGSRESPQEKKKEAGRVAKNEKREHSRPDTSKRSPPKKLKLSPSKLTTSHTVTEVSDDEVPETPNTKLGRVIKGARLDIQQTVGEEMSGDPTNWQGMIEFRGNHIEVVMLLLEVDEDGTILAPLSCHWAQCLLFSFFPDIFLLENAVGTEDGAAMVSVAEHHVRQLRLGEASGYACQLFIMPSSVPQRQDEQENKKLFDHMHKALVDDGKNAFMRTPEVKMLMTPTRELFTGYAMLSGTCPDWLDGKHITPWPR